ncbi:hypothetical protein GTH32_01490 [Alteromonas sp. 345S023]|uniref:Glutamine amidotransferase domain-containing protein n=1 Tax=Alteromonas profundi TaxID=2696062 RepID=A0A7X5RJH1_9ALTE|nr:gamma-glutamyl-gamma-aminobutyrate hydrolase family protein [Alteromonas profundi]NDV89868.1 hypothetical protein [Alteromonas profundi]
MNTVFVTQRVDKLQSRNETRDSLDQKWASLLMHCRLLPILIPNNVHAAEALYKKITPSGLLLTGGNSLVAYGGDAPQRDETEKRLLDIFFAEQKPVLGVCRGMQVIQDKYGQALTPVTGHIARKQQIEYKGILRTVNSYHELGTRNNTTEFNVDAQSLDGVIKAISHPKAPIVGIMWHPEREEEFCAHDIKFIKEFFNR